MRRLTDTDGLSDVQRDILRTVRDFVDDEVLPVATELDHTDALEALRSTGADVMAMTVDVSEDRVSTTVTMGAAMAHELRERDRRRAAGQALTPR